MKPSYAPQPSAAHAPSASGAVATTCECSGRMPWRKKPSAGVYALVASTSARARTSPSRRRERDLRALAHARTGVCSYTRRRCATSARAQRLEQRDAVEARRERIEHRAVRARARRARSPAGTRRESPAARSASTRACGRLGAPRVGVDLEAARGGGRPRRRVLRRQRLGEVDALARHVVDAARAPPGRAASTPLIQFSTCPPLRPLAPLAEPPRFEQDDAAIRRSARSGARRSRRR